MLTFVYKQEFIYFDKVHKLSRYSKEYYPIRLSCHYHVYHLYILATTTAIINDAWILKK